LSFEQTKSQIELKNQSCAALSNVSQTFLDKESDLLFISNQQKSCVSMKGKSEFQMKSFDLGFKHFILSILFSPNQAQ